MLADCSILLDDFIFHALTKARIEKHNLQFEQSFLSYNKRKKHNIEYEKSMYINDNFNIIYSFNAFNRDRK